MRWSIEELFWALRMVWSIVTIKSIPRYTYLTFYHILFWLFHGYSDYSLWNLDGFLIDVMVKRLENFQNHSQHKIEMMIDGYYPDEQELQDMISKIILGFKLYKESIPCVENQDIINDAFKLFGENFGKLWD